MSDTVFTIKGVKKAGKDHFHKQSVIWPLMRRRSLVDATVKQDVRCVIRHWRKRLNALYAHEWADLLTEGRLQYARNCPPTIVVASTPSVMKPCNMWHICPWCFCRKNEALYDLLASFLPERGGYRRPKFCLLEVRDKDLKTEAEAGTGTGAQMLELRHDAQTYVKRIKPLGAHFNVTMDPKSTHGSKSLWRRRYSILAMVEPDYRIPEWLNEKGRTVRLTEMQCRRQLISILARTCRYPVGLMYGDIEMTIRSLNARRGKRCTALTGCFRANKTHAFIDEDGT